VSEGNAPGRAIFLPRTAHADPQILIDIAKDIVRQQTEHGGISPIRYEVPRDIWEKLVKYFKDAGLDTTRGLRVLDVPVIHV